MHYGNNNDRGTPKMLYVMNITDVDDKIIQRSGEMASEQQKPPLDKNWQSFEQQAIPIALARRYEREFWQDMDQLNVLRPDVVVVCRVSEHVNSTFVGILALPYHNSMLEFMWIG
jgi:cysteinyl-tRNA synthetase